MPFPRLTPPCPLGLYCATRTIAAAASTGAGCRCNSLHETSPARCPEKRAQRTGAALAAALGFDVPVEVREELRRVLPLREAESGVLGQLEQPRQCLGCTARGGRALDPGKQPRWVGGRPGARHERTRADQNLRLSVSPTVRGRAFSPLESLP